MTKSKPVAASAEPASPKKPVSVGVFVFPRATEQAWTAVDPNKSWSWPEDGPVLKAAVEAAYAEFRAQAEPILAELTGVAWPQVRLSAVIAIIVEVVRQWDDLFGWDAPRLTEVQEDAFYDVVVRQTVSLRFKQGL